MNLEHLPRPEKADVLPWLVFGLLSTFMSYAIPTYLAGTLFALIGGLLYYRVYLPPIDRLWGYRHYLVSHTSNTVRLAPSLIYVLPDNETPIMLREEFTFTNKVWDSCGAWSVRSYRIRFDREYEPSRWRSYCVSPAQATTFIRWTQTIPWVQMRNRMTANAFLCSTNQSVVGFVLEAIGEDFN